MCPTARVQLRLGQRRLAEKEIGVARDIDEDVRGAESPEYASTSPSRSTRKANALWP